jgi:hypothetical protein
MLAIIRYGITRIMLTPSLLNSILICKRAVSLWLRMANRLTTVVLCGEVCSSTLLTLAQEKMHHKVHFYNLYSLSECHDVGFLAVNPHYGDHLSDQEIQFTSAHKSPTVSSSAMADELRNYSSASTDDSQPTISICPQVNIIIIGDYVSTKRFSQESKCQQQAVVVRSYKVVIRSVALLMMHLNNLFSR